MGIEKVHVKPAGALVGIQGDIRSVQRNQHAAFSIRAAPKVKTLDLERPVTYRMTGNCGGCSTGGARRRCVSGLDSQNNLAPRDINVKIGRASCREREQG